MAKLGPPARSSECPVFQNVLAGERSPSDLVDIVLSFWWLRGVPRHQGIPRPARSPEGAPPRRGAPREESERAKAAISKGLAAPQALRGKVGVLSRGPPTSPSLRRPRVTAELLGCDTAVEYDVGVAGITGSFPPQRRKSRSERPGGRLQAGRGPSQRWWRG